MKMSYLAHEVELSKRHEKILSLRAALLQQMEDQLESQVKEKKLQAIKFESANERNELLLKDLEAEEKNLRAGVHLQLHPAVTALETKYWASIEEQLPKWEQLFLGQTRNPVEAVDCKENYQDTKHKAMQPNSPKEERVELKGVAVFPGFLLALSPQEAKVSLDC